MHCLASQSPNWLHCINSEINGAASILQIEKKAKIPIAFTQKLGMGVQQAISASYQLKNMVFKYFVFDVSVDIPIRNDIILSWNDCFISQNCI